MTDSDQTPAAVPDDAPPVEPTPTPHVHPALWVLVVLGAFLALGALWFALFGGPQRVGTDTQAGPGSPAATSTASGAATSTAGNTPTATVSITLDDVNAVIAQVDYTESTDSSITEYNNTLTHVLAGVDVAAFAQSTLEKTSTIWWIEPGGGGLRVLAGAEKNAIVAESIASYLKREAAFGDATALSDMLGVRMYQPTSIDRNRQDSLLEVVSQGLAPLGLMFGARDADDDWTWRIEDVSITGPDTADVTYSANVRHKPRWKFADPSVRYTKHLAFSHVAGGRWRLAGWSNYPEVNSEFRSNITPRDTAIRFDEWWSAL